MGPNIGTSSLPYGSMSTVLKKLKSLSLHGRISLLAIPFLHNAKWRIRRRLKHYCNGLALFSDYCVCNLTTKKYEILPKNPHDSPSASHSCLAFDPVISPYYKIVLIHDTYLNPSYPFDIYSSPSKSWKRIYVNSAPKRYGVAVWDGAINWVNENNDYVRFYVDEERLLSIQMPPKFKILKWYNIRYFEECAGELLLIQCRKHSFRFNVLMMKRGTCSWNVKYCVDPNRVNFEVSTREYIVLRVGKESHRIDYVLLLATPSNLISYNLENNSIQVLHNISLKEYSNITYSRWYPRVPLNESLVPVGRL